ncbi:MAG: metalloprotease TldD [Pelagibacteraceae bacterium]|nr:metalloprotease TldD [Pelagibacteraceae bacterium]|tara:strand:+ start:1554 stop:2987 length:1434 start_codon:yes stop_codon:yes gene_type:complete
MNKINNSYDLFFKKENLDFTKTEKIVNESLRKADDGELFLEFKQSENFIFDDKKIKNASTSIDKGFGLRSVKDETSAYSHSSDISEKSILNAGKTVKSILSSSSKSKIIDPIRTNKKHYSNTNPLNNFTSEEKTKLLKSIDNYARKLDKRVKQVSASLSGEWQVVHILRKGGYHCGDIRPLVRLNISITVDNGKRMETGSSGVGGRKNYIEFFNDEYWKKQTKDALRQAITNLKSSPTPAGKMPIVLGPGWPGIILHEAIGHGLEGDFNRKKISVFSDLLGKKIASKNVTVVDDGTINNRRGSITVDDEGTPSQCTPLIENGIMVGHMQDRLNARLMKTKTTGNGRRESYEYLPMPRMTNTYMLSGNVPQEDIFKSVKKGLYAVNFSGGSVDITSGQFEFSASEAYMIENGKITKPVKGATLIGKGEEVLKKISLVGNNMALDGGIGTCGKEGQGVPVGVGQPTILVDEILVGGTDV